MSDSEALIRISKQVVDAIAQGTIDELSLLLAPGFQHRTPGGKSHGAAEFLRGLRELDLNILSIELKGLDVDIHGDGAIVTGTQHAQVATTAGIVDDQSAFADWFIRLDGQWRLRLAVEFRPDA